jgi:hypothetical protein
MQNRRLLLVLPPEVYRQLQDAARAEDRDVVEQARFILRRALVGTTPPQTPEERR